MKKILFVLLFITIAFSQFDNTIAGWYNDNYYVPSGSVYSEGLVIADESTLATESLNETTFATTLKWTGVPDFTENAGVAFNYAHSGGTGSLTQTQGNLAIAGVGDRWYKFAYTISNETSFVGGMTITTGFASSAVSLNVVDGTHTVYFKSKTTPVDFVLSATSTAGSFTIDDVTLKEITGGDGYIAGNFSIGSISLPLGYTRHIDIEIGATVLGPNAPTATTVGTFRGLGFDADNEEAFVNFEIPSDWDGTSDMLFELHWYPTSGDAIANGETVKWDVTYRSIAIGEAVDNGTVVSITATFTGGGSETDKENYRTFITIDYDNVNQPLVAGDDLGIQFDRDVTTDTYSGAGIVFRINLTYTSNTLPDN